jgi:hypothetical protein
LTVFVVVVIVFLIFVFGILPTGNYAEPEAPSVSATIDYHEEFSDSEEVYGNEHDESRRLAIKYKAKREIVLPDGARCDLVNDQYAIEVDYAPKWAEAIGQSLYYASVLRRKPAIILLCDMNSQRYVNRAKYVCAEHGITLFQERAK